MELCTFVPKINKPRAKTMKRNPSVEKEGKGEESESRIHQLAKPQRIYEKYKKDREDKELQYCTFQPQLDKKSRKMVAVEYDQFKKGSQIVTSGNPSTGKAKAKVVETAPNMFRHDQLHMQYQEKQ